MFWKNVPVGGAHVYKKVIDWDAVLGTAFFIVVGLAALGSCGG